MYHHPFKGDENRIYARVNDNNELKSCRVRSELFNTNDDDPISSWRILKIMSEFVAGFDLLQRYGLAASIFGSARSKEDDAMYQ